MAERKVRKSEAILDSLERAGELTRDGRNWLIAAVDPFHDTQIKPEGYPDLVTGASVVQCVKQQAQISCPSSVTSGTWDCLIFNMPWLDPQHGIKNLFQNSTNMTLYEGLGTSWKDPVGGLLVASAATAPTLGFADATTTVTSLSLGDSYFTGPTRAIAMGFEVTNTTAEIYQQGSATVFRVPQPSRGTRHVHNIMTGNTTTPGSLAGAVASEWRVIPPASLASAQLLPGSRTWHAKEGAYVVLTQSGEGLRDPIEEPILPIMVDPSALTKTTQQVDIVCPAFNATTVPAKPPLVAVHDYNLSGVWFSGLSLQSTLTVNFNVYLERFPSQTQLDLVTLASPSPRYDPLALELYSRMMDRMPVGVMVSENGLGDWFAGTIAQAAPFISKMLSSIPHPYAQAGAVLAEGAGKVASHFLPAPGEKGDGLRKSSAGVGTRAKVKKARKIKAAPNVRVRII